MEVWKKSTSYPAYSASSLGRVMVNPYAAKMPYGGERTYGGHPWFGAWSEQDNRFVVMRKGKTLRVARIVCDAFHGPAPAGLVCMHLDENSRNNRPENLAWGSQKENMNAPGFKAKRRFHFKVLSDDDVRDIRKDDRRNCDVARAYGVHPVTVCNIRKRRTRTTVAD